MRELETILGSVAAIDWLSLLLDAGAKSSLIIVGVLVLLRMWKTASASMRHWIWSLAFFTLVLVPIPFTRSPALSVVWNSRAMLGNQNELARVEGERVRNSARDLSAAQVVESGAKGSRAASAPAIASGNKAAHSVR